MKYDRNIALLKDMLQSLGFEEGLENKLRAHICFQPGRFTIRTRIHKEPDVMDFVLYFEKHDSNGYACRYYDAVLRKRSLLDEQVMLEVNIQALDKRMALVDWNLPTLSISATMDREEAIDAIITDLRKLEEEEEGRRIAEHLRMKYWSGTLVEELVGSTGSKSRQEIMQRFYFFDGRSQITVEEAYRYLCNRWMEKEMNSKKKQPDITEEKKEGNEEDLQKKSKAGAKKKGR